MESFRLASTERHASIDILRIAIGNRGTAIGNGGIAIGNGGIAIGKGSSPGAIGETLRAIEMMQQLNTALSWANEQGHIEPSNGGIAIGKGSSPGAIGETLRAIEMMQQLNTALSWANEQGHIEPSARWSTHSWFVETLRNMPQIRKRPDAWSVDHPDTRAYHSEMRVLRADADAP